MNTAANPSNLSAEEMKIYILKTMFSMLEWINRWWYFKDLRGKCLFLEHKASGGKEGARYFQQLQPK